MVFKFSMSFSTHFVLGIVAPLHIVLSRRTSLTPNRFIRQLCANDRFGLNIVRSPPSCIRPPLMQRGRESLPIYYINKVYLPFSASLLSLLHPFFVIFLNFLSCFFAGLRKSLTFALAKRERLLLYGGVGFLAQMKKEFFERFS